MPYPPFTDAAILPCQRLHGDWDRRNTSEADQTCRHCPALYPAADFV